MRHSENGFRTVAYIGNAGEPVFAILYLGQTRSSTKIVLSPQLRKVGR